MRTPYFIAYPNKILENYHIMQSILPVEEVFYSTKPNVENITFDALAKGNASFDIVKLSEMKRLVRLGVAPNKIICSLPIKNSYEIKKMYELGCRYFVYDCEQEYKKLIELAPSALKIARIKIDDKENEGIEYGLSKKELITMTEKGIRPNGYTFYILNVSSKLDILKKTFETIEYLLSFHGGEPLVINIGGNYPLPNNANDIFYSNLNLLIEGLKKRYSSLKFIAEPGRSIVTNAFDLVTTVLAVKNDNRVFLDAHSQIIKMPPQSIEVKSDNYIRSMERYCFYENLCSHYLLFEGSTEKKLEVGDRLLLKSCGSYSSCFANRFHGTGLPYIRVVTNNDREIK